MSFHGLWIVIPAYNEASVIESSLREVSEYFPNIVVVDDGSRDGTAEKVSYLGVWLVPHVVNQGQGAALQTGIEFALRRGAEYVCTFDADGQHDAASIPKMYEILRSEDVDVVLGTRFGTETSNVPPFRRLVLTVALFVTKLQTGLPLTDTHNGLRMFRRSALIDLRLEQRGMAHASELLSYISAHRFTVMEISSVVKYTDYSLAKGQKLSNAFRIAFDLFYAKLMR